MITELRNFIEAYNVEWHRHENDDGKMDVLIFLKFNQMDAFADIIGPNMLDDDGIQIVLKHGYVVIRMLPICYYFEVELNDVFPWDADKFVTEREIEQL